MRIPIIIFMGMLIPLGAAAESVAILPVSYHLYRTDAPSMERALKVADAVATGVEQAGMTPIRGPNVEAAGQAVNGGADCRDATCAGEVAKAAGADFGIFVSVVDKDGQFDIEIHLSGAEPVTVSPYDTFNAMIQRVTGLVESSLKEAAARVQRAPIEEEVPGESKPDQTGKGQVEELPLLPPPDPEKKRLKPLAFYISMGVTAAVGAGYTAIESVGYVKLKKAEGKEDEAKRRKDLKTLQLVDRIMLGCTAASAIASVVIFFFTDFQSSSGNNAPSAATGVRIVPVATEKGAGLGMSGEF